MRKRYLGKIYFLLTLFVATFSLSACAFHFRDQHSAPVYINNIYILDQTDNRTGLEFLLRHDLKAVGINTEDSPCNAPLRLIILNNQFGQTITTLGTAQQLNSQVITYSVTVVLKNKKDKAITQPAKLITSTAFWQNSNQILGDTAAIPELKQLLVREMSQKILAYLSANQTKQAILNDQNR